MQFSRDPCTFFFVGLNQYAPYSRQGVLGQLSVDDVQTRSDVASKTAVLIESRHTDVEDPAVLSIITSHAILHRKRLPLIEGRQICFQAAFYIIGVDSFCPAVFQLSF